MHIRTVGAFALLLLLSFSASAQDLFFSEYIEGSSNNKALEIYNPTGSPVNLAAGGYNVQMFFNGSASAGLTINLTGSVAAGDVFVIGHASANAAILAQADQTNGAGWFNGDDAVVLRRGTTVLDVIGQIGFDPGTEWGSGLASTADNTLRRKASISGGDPNGADVFDPSVEWEGFATDTFSGLGAHSIGDPTPTPTPTPVPVLEIFEIQGSGLVSAVAGQIVKTIDNVVTALAPNGFFIQTPDARADASAETSNGLFVFTSSAPSVLVGDVVDVQGTVTEFFELTELTSVTVTRLGTAALPSYVTLDATRPSPSAANPHELERYEGMLVVMENGTATAPTDRFGDVAVVARSTRAYREPGLDWDGNPEVFEIDPDALGLPNAQVPAGSVIHRAAGPLAFAFGDYQIWPTEFSFTPAELPLAVRARTPGEFTVATQNVLRLFDTINDPGVDDEVFTPQAYSRKLDKLALQVIGVLGAPDILVVQEAEKLAVLEDLAARIASLPGGVLYSAHLLEGNDVGGIDVGFLVRDTISVKSLEQFGPAETWTFAGSTTLLNDRPPLILRAEYVGNGQPFPITVIGVHQRSLSSIETARVQAKRYEQAIRLARFVDEMLAQAPETRLVMAGDFNAFQFSDGYVEVMGILTGDCDPVPEIYGCDPSVDADLTNQVLSLPEAERYSFIFDGSAQVLDHALTSTALNPFVRGFAYGRGNADAPAIFDNDAATPLRSSDHDGGVLFVMSDGDGDGLADDADSCPASDTRSTVVVGGCDSATPNLELSPGCYLSDRISALRASSRNHGQFVAAVARLSDELKKDGRLSAEQAAKLNACAGQSN